MVYKEVNLMFPNLRAEMARKGIGSAQMSARVGFTPRSLSNKLNGKTEFTRSEMFKIQKELFPDLTVEYLFSYSEEKVLG
jgi:transcriptional regulator with XRE-family HTH domain